MYTRPMLLAGLALCVCFAQACDVDLGSFSTQERIAGSGVMSVQAHEVSDIERVALTTIGELTIELGDEESLRIECDDNLQEYITVEMKSGELVIGKDNNVQLRPKKPIRYFLTAKQLSGIRLSSSGKAKCPSIESDSFTVRISSSGDLVMDGISAKTADIHISSSGDAHIESVKADDIEIHASSSGDAVISSLSAQALLAEISSSGFVEFKQGSVDRATIRCSSSGDFKAKRVEFNSVDAHASSSGGMWLHVNETLTADCSSSGHVNYGGEPQVSKKISSSGKVRPM